MADGSAALTLRLVLGLVIVAVTSAQGTRFPYCECIRPTGANNSPYRVSARPPVTTNGVTKLCWSLTASAEATGPCSDFDLKKIEIKINKGCRGAVRKASFSSNAFDVSYTYYETPDAMVLKITRGGKRVLGTFDELVGKTTSVCLNMQPGTTCNDRESFCAGGVCNYAFFSPDNKCCPGNRPPNTTTIIRSPPPPPPKRTSPFPYCVCERTPIYNSFSLAPADKAPVANKVNGLNKYCWTLDATRYSSPRASCTNFDLKKIEWDVNNNCQGSVAKVTLNSDVISESFSSYPDNPGALVFKVTRGNRYLIALDKLTGPGSARLCITLRGKCPTLQSFCKQPFCRIAFFSDDNNCCPLDTLASST